MAGPSVRPEWPWPMASHRPSRPGARPITGRESAKQGRAPSHGAFSTGSPSGNSEDRRRHEAPELHRRRRGVAGGEFRAGGEPDALLHRREAITVLRIEHRPREPRIAARAEMPVITALDRERQRNAERRQEVAAPTARAPPRRRRHRSGPSAWSTRHVAPARCRLMASACDARRRRARKTAPHRRG